MKGKSKKKQAGGKGGGGEAAKKARTLRPPRPAAAEKRVPRKVAAKKRGAAKARAQGGRAQPRGKAAPKPPEIPLYRRILVLGARGMLGTDLVEMLQAALPEGSSVLAADLQEFDLTDRQTTLGWIGRERPELVINCAAFTAVDGAEEDRQAALAVNRDGAGHAAEAAAAVGADFWQISTDFVFDGRKRTPYLEEDPPGPRSAYAISKWQGETLVQLRHPAPLILRTSWLFGPHGRNFVRTILNLARSREELMIVDDQVGRPTYTRDLAGVLLALLPLRPAGQVIHAANDGGCSWFDYACRIVELAGLSRQVRILPISSEEYAAPAPRPAYSVLSLERLTRLLGRRPRHWTAALEEYLERFELRGEGEAEGREGPEGEKDPEDAERRAAAKPVREG